MKKQNNFNPINSEIAQEWYRNTFGDMSEEQAIKLMFPPQPSVEVWCIDKAKRTITIKMEDLNKEAWQHLFQVSLAIREKKLKEISDKYND